MDNFPDAARRFPSSAPEDLERICVRLVEVVPSNLVILFLSVILPIIPCLEMLKYAVISSVISSVLFSLTTIFTLYLSIT